jgi:DNA-binding NarL/FixJ family response regulator
MDLNMPGLDGLDALREIRQWVPAAGIVVLTLHFSVSLTCELKRAGARGYVMKSDADRDLLAAIEAVAAGKTYFTPLAEAATAPLAKSASTRRHPRPTAAPTHHPRTPSRPRPGANHAQASVAGAASTLQLPPMGKLFPEVLK